LIPLFLSLGVWQLRRADEKIALMELRLVHEQDPPMRLTGAQEDPELLRYRRVQVEGDYDPAHQFLLDNQMQESRVGFHVLTPLRIRDAGVAVLVNRGWVPQGQNRADLPNLELSDAVAQVSGRVEKFPSVGFRLEGAEIPAPGWPSLVQVADAEQLSRRLGYRVLPYQVLLDSDQRDGYVRDWHPASLDPGKNRGYALQWFSFAALVAALYVWYGFKPRPGAGA
jgi:surfeit locus 1 family protein